MKKNSNLFVTIKKICLSVFNPTEAMRRAIEALPELPQEAVKALETSNLIHLSRSIQSGSTKYPQGFDVQSDTIPEGWSPPKGDLKYVRWSTLQCSDGTHPMRMFVFAFTARERVYRGFEILEIIE